MHVIDLTGQRFTRWTVIRRTQNTTQGQARWLCRCDCGTEAVMLSILLRHGISRSCGCLKRERHALRSTKHGHATNGISPTYHSWAGMVARCTNPRHTAAAHYSRNGVRVCERWLTFSNFLTDMGEKPSGMSLDRFPDHKGNYEPGNCRWATPTEQSRNKANNRIMTLNGVSKTMAEWCDDLGMNRGTLSHRIHRAGWSDEKALTTPVRR